MAEKDKVFDVAKPGSSAPDTGSKPMVVGHKMMKDPTLKEIDESSEIETNEQPIAQTASKTIQPIDHSEDKSESDDHESEKTESIEDESTKEELVSSDLNKGEEKDEPAPENESDTEVEKPSETKEEKEKASLELDAEREENLQKMINEKTYNVPIKEAASSATTSFIKTFALVLLLGILLLVVLVDAEVIDLGISLPFDFL